MSFSDIADLVSNSNLNRSKFAVLIAQNQITGTFSYIKYCSAPLSTVKKETNRMPEISLYIDKETLQKLEKAAQAEELSISKWVEKQLNKSLKDDYPADFKNLFGSITDESFTVPE